MPPHVYSCTNSQTRKRWVARSLVCRWVVQGDMGPLLQVNPLLVAVIITHVYAAIRLCFRYDTWKVLIIRWPKDRQSLTNGNGAFTQKVASRSSELPLQNWAIRWNLQFNSLLYSGEITHDPSHLSLLWGKLLGFSNRIRIVWKQQILS